MHRRMVPKDALEKITFGKLLIIPGQPVEVKGDWIAPAE